MNKTSKNHHYVPQCLLKNFSIKNKGKQIVVFDKLAGKSHVSSLKNAGSENNFNVLDFGDRKVNFEEIFQEIDTLTARIVKKIINSEDLAELCDEEIYNLAEITLVQISRTKLQRTAFIDLGEQLEGVMQRAGLNPDNISDFAKPTENEAKLALIKHLAKLEKLIPCLVEKTILLLKTSKTKPFWISDNPVVFHNSFPYGELGLNSKGVEIYFPISKVLCIAFFCPSIMLKQKNNISQLLNRDNNNPILSQNEFAYFVRPGTLDAKSNVELVNKLQVSLSSRFLYSNNDDFSIAQHLLSRTPQLRNVKGRLHLSEMGQTSPVNEKLPLGDILVIFTKQDHYMLPIKYIADEADSSCIKFFTTEFDMLKTIQANSPFEEVTVYRNGRGMGGMRDAEFEAIDYTGIQPIKIKHIDNSLNQFFKLIDERRH